MVKIWPIRGQNPKSTFMEAAHYMKPTPGKIDT